MLRCRPIQALGGIVQPTLRVYRLGDGPIGLKSNVALRQSGIRLYLRICFGQTRIMENSPASLNRLGAGFFSTTVLGHTNRR